MLTTALIVGLALGLQAAPEAQMDGGKSGPRAESVEKRVPLKADDQVRTTELDLRQYHRVMSIERTRSNGKKFASFRAEPLLLDDGVAVVFQVHSIADSGTVPRWRCIATEDVADCLGKKLRIRYLPNDDKIVLSAVLVPETELPEVREALAWR